MKTAGDKVVRHRVTLKRDGKPHEHPRPFFKHGQEAIWRKAVVHNTVKMGVIDSLVDDAVESFDGIDEYLNDDHPGFWRAIFGRIISRDEIAAALAELIAEGMVTPYKESVSHSGCDRVPAAVYFANPSDVSLWFHLEDAGRDALRYWLEVDGKHLLPPSDIA